MRGEIPRFGRPGLLYCIVEPVEPEISPMSARLILHPETPGYAPAELVPLQRVLVDIGLLGACYGDYRVQSSEQRYLIGKHFLQLVSFMGCAPAIELAPPADAGDESFCHIALSDIQPQPMFAVDAVLASPRCPHCRQRQDDWAQRVEHWRHEPRYRYECRGCHAALSPTELNWRRNGGFGRVFVSIFGIYPREAIPTEHLLACLQRATEQDWNYFYAR